MRALHFFEYVSCMCTMPRQLTPPRDQCCVVESGVPAVLSPQMLRAAGATAWLTLSLSAGDDPALVRVAGHAVAARLPAGRLAHASWQASRAMLY
jgi:hypothetical protein